MNLSGGDPEGAGKGVHGAASHLRVIAIIRCTKTFHHDSPCG
jgi:hypothetical protein